MKFHSPGATADGFGSAVFFVNVGILFGANAGYHAHMNVPHRKRIQHYHEPGDVHELTFSCYRRKPLLTNDVWCSDLAEAVDRSCERHRRVPRAKRLESHVLCPFFGCHWHCQCAFSIFMYSVACKHVPKESSWLTENKSNTCMNPDTCTNLRSRFITVARC